MVLGSKNGAKLAPKWDQISISQKTRKNAFGTSPLVPNWVQGVQDGSKNQAKIDPNMESKMGCILASIFYAFQWILGGKLGGKMDQTLIQKGLGKRMEKKRCKKGKFSSRNPWSGLGPPGAAWCWGAVAESQRPRC